MQHPLDSHALEQLEGATLSLHLLPPAVRKRQLSKTFLTVRRCPAMPLLLAGGGCVAGIGGCLPASGQPLSTAPLLYCRAMRRQLTPLQAWSSTVK